MYVPVCTCVCLGGSPATQLMPHRKVRVATPADPRGEKSEGWGPPQFQEKRSRSEKAILGALGESQGILGAALGIRNSILGIRNCILGMASHDLSNTKTTILGATPGAIPGVDGSPHERFSFAPAFSERFLRIGVVPARQKKSANFGR